MEGIPYKVTGVQTVLQAHGSQSQVQSMILRTKRKNTWSEDTESVRAEGRCLGTGPVPKAGWSQETQSEQSQEDQWPGRQHFLKFQNRNNYLESNAEICLILKLVQLC